MKSWVIAVPAILLAGLGYMVVDGMQRISDAWGPLASMGIMIAISVCLFLSMILAMVLAFVAVLLNTQAKMVAQVVEANAEPSKHLFKMATQMAMLAKGMLRNGNGAQASPPVDAWVVDALPGSGDPSRPALPWPDEAPPAQLPGPQSAVKRQGMFIAR